MKRGQPRKLVAFLGVLSTCFGSILAYMMVCLQPSLDGKPLVEQARFEAENELRETGRVGDIEAALRYSLSFSSDGARSLKEYRIVVREVGDHYEIRAEPRSWSCCRQTYITSVRPTESGVH